MSWNLWLICSLNLPLRDENKYDLINYWNCTGFTGDEINNFYKTTVDDQLAVLHFKEQEKCGEPINALKIVGDFLFSKVKSSLRSNGNFDLIWETGFKLCVLN